MDSGNAASLFQHQQQDATHVRLFLMVLNFLALFVIIALGTLVILKFRESARRKASTSAAISEHDAQLQRELELQQGVGHGPTNTAIRMVPISSTSTSTRTHTKRSPEACARQAQKRRDAYLETFQRNQVQLVSS
jgi:hypothetical protein